MDEVPAIRRGMDYAKDSQDAGQPTVSAVAVIQEADTGARPLMIHCDDGHVYWCKGPGNPHGNLTLAHEWVVSELSRVLAGPLPHGVLIEVDDELISGHRIDGARRVGGTWFGSRLVQGDEHTLLVAAHRDGNPERIPYYLGLWHLCLGVDPQFITERREHDRIWSIDHGLWFANDESDWNVEGDLDKLVHRTWQEPDWEDRQRVSATACLAAADAIARLSGEIVGEIVGTVPVDWGIPDSDLEQLAAFILARRTRAVEKLRVRARQQ